MSKLLFEKYIKVSVKKELQEQEEKAKKSEKSMYLIYRFPGLKKAMEDLMSPAFGRYVSDCSIVAPKPTTFIVKLINHQEFTITYLGKGNFNAKIAGRKYFLNNLSELQRASQGITDLLELNYAPEEGKESPNPSSPNAAPDPFDGSSSGGSFTPPGGATGGEDFSDLANDLADNGDAQDAASASDGAEELPTNVLDDLPTDPSEDDLPK